jgi:hypothetical protein
VVALVALLTLVPIGGGTGSARQADGERATGAIFASVQRQAGLLPLDAPRPRLLTQFQAPTYVTDVDVAATGWAVIVVRSIFAGSDVFGGDLIALDPRSGDTQPLVVRADATESFGAPQRSADGSWLVFHREDQRRPPVAYPYQADVRYPTRIEAAASDGLQRRILVDDGLQPALSPDGSTVAYVRPSAAGTALLARRVDALDERELVPAGRFPDVGHPRFSPGGDRIAIAVAVLGGARDGPFMSSFLAGLALAHGLPWDIWTIGIDGSELHLTASVGADDPNVAWSPDGRQLFVYGGTGSFIVDVSSGEIRSLPYLAGYGSIAWVPDF